MSVYRKAVNAWGVDSQAMIVAEECCELVTALSQFLRGRVATMAVVEEIADVQIMLEHIDPEREEMRLENLKRKAMEAKK